MKIFPSHPERQRKSQVTQKLRCQIMAIPSILQQVVFPVTQVMIFQVFRTSKPQHLYCIPTCITSRGSPRNRRYYFFFYISEVCPLPRPNSLILQLIHPHSPLHSEKKEINTGFAFGVGQLRYLFLYILSRQAKLHSFASHQVAPPLCPQTMPANDCHGIY